MLAITLLTMIQWMAKTAYGLGRENGHINNLFVHDIQVYKNSEKQLKCLIHIFCISLKDVYRLWDRKVCYIKNETRNI